MRGLPVIAFILFPILHGAPWIIDHWLGMVASWLGIACGLYLTTASTPFNRLLCLWIAGSLSIGIAFHWSPDAMTYTLSSEYWLGLLVALPLILWDGLRLALGYWLGARLCPRREWIWLTSAITTILLEEVMPGVFPWRLGLMQLPWPWWLQGVDTFGSAWSTLLAFAVAGTVLLVAWRVRERRVAQDAQPQPRWALISAAALLLLNASYCGWSWQHWQSQLRGATTVRLGLVQVDPSHKVSLQQLQELTRQVASDAQLICWPESSGGTYDLRLNELSDAERNFQLSREPDRGLRPWPQPTCELLLAGKNYQHSNQHSRLKPVSATAINAEADEPDKLFVSAMLLDDRERIVARYHKRYLMPFGEYVPGENIVPGMAELFDMAEHVTRGDGSAVLLSQTGARVGVMLCYEDMVPQAARSAVQQEANVLVSLINGSAFTSSVTLHQHRLLSHMRALETRRSFVRCAATGQTCVIDACGQLVESLPYQTNGSMCRDVPLLEGQSIHSRYPHLLLSLVGVALVVLVVRQRHVWRRPV